MPDDTPVTLSLDYDNADDLVGDVYLPLLDGGDVIAQARGALGLADLPIIAVSGGGETARQWALDAGANVFLDKPMRLRHIFDAITQLVQVGAGAAT
jgi:CheY-like chemotaxis protein